MPTNCESGNAFAMRIVLAPWPQPTSAARAPRVSFADTPSKAGSQEDSRLALYPAREMLAPFHSLAAAKVLPGPLFDVIQVLYDAVGAREVDRTIRIREAQGLL